MDSEEQAKEDQPSGCEEELTKEKLMIKCKNILSIAQKAKSARDEALIKIKTFENEVGQLNDKIKGFEEASKAKEEILVALTDKKLQLAMENDDLKRQKTRFIAEMRSMCSDKEKAESEAKNSKTELEKAQKENNDLRYNLMEKVNSETQLQNDIQKLHENNESIKLLFAKENKEKMDLEESLEKLTHQISSINEEKNIFFNSLSDLYQQKFVDYNSVLKILSQDKPQNLELLLENLSKEVSNYSNLTENPNENPENLTKYKDFISLLQEKLNTVIKTQVKPEEFEKLAQLETENKNLKIEIEKIINNEKQSSENFDNSIFSLREKLVDVSAYKDELEFKLENITSQNNQLLAQIKELNEKSNQLKLENETLISANETKDLSEQSKSEERIKRLSIELQNAKEDRDKIENTLEQVKDEIKQLIDNADSLSKEIEVLNTEVEKLNQEKNDNLVVINQQQNQIDELLLKLKEHEVMHNKIKSLNKEIESKQEMYFKLENEFEISRQHSEAQINELTQQIETHKTTEEIKNNLEDELEHINQISQEKDVKINKLNEELKKYQQDVSKLKASFDSQSLELEEIKILKQKHEEELELIKEATKAKDVKINELNEERKKYQQNVIDLKASLDSQSLGLQEIKILKQKHEEELELIKEATKAKDVKINELNEELKKYQQNVTDLKASFDSKSLELEEIKILRQKHEETKEELELTKEATKEKDVKINELTDEISSLESKSRKLEEAIGIITNLENEVENGKEILNLKCLELEKITAEIVEKDEKISELSKEMEIVVKKLEISDETCSKLEIEIEEIKQELNLKSLEIENINKELEEHVNERLENSVNKQDLDEKDEKIVTLARKLENITEINNKLKKEVEDGKELVNLKYLELEQINTIWAGKLQSLRTSFINIKKNLKETSNQYNFIHKIFSEEISNLSIKIKEFVEVFVEQLASNTKHELLNEMHCMNQALKERGEVISKLQETIGELQMNKAQTLDKNIELENKMIQLEKNLKDAEVKLMGKEELIKEMENELIRSREGKDTNADVSDVLSTSTLSKNDESFRLRELEESFEDRYIKLKTIAVKLKKKLADTLHQLDTERARFAAEKAELLDKNNHLSTTAKNVQAVQESFDRLLDELEEKKAENAKLITSLKEICKNEESLKSQLSSSEANNQHLVAMRKQIDNLDNSLKESKKEVQKLELENKVEKMKYEELRKTSGILENKVKDLTESLEQAVQQGRSSNVLELEIKNYEKIITDLTAQLSSEKLKNNSINNEKSSLDLVKSGLEEQIQLLERQVKAEEERNQCIKAELTIARDKNDELNVQVKEISSQMSELKNNLNISKSKCEQLTVEMSNLTSEFSKKDIDMQHKFDALRSHVQTLETALASSKQELMTAQSEVEHIRAEFESYRHRAQTTLAKQKGDSISEGEKDARELVEKLKTELNSLRSEMESSLANIETLSNRNSNLESEKKRFEKRYEEVTIVLHQKIADFDSLNKEYTAYKLSTDAMLHKLKTEFSIKEESLKKENSGLNELVFTLKDKLMEIDVEKKLQEIAQEDILHEREDAEGSENVQPFLGRRMSNPVPLDVLLNSPIDDESSMLQGQLNKLANELSTYELRVKHLSSLLSEAEKDAARNAHQNKILKDEMRRLERSLERQPHIANTEYLKNIIFKFLTLNHGDEKTRLVPVLETILKLSPEEHHKLQAVAKGEAGWGSYLPSWN